MIPPRTGKGVVVVHVLRSYCLRFSFSHLFSDVCFLFSIRIVGAFFRDDASKKSENGKSLENLKIENTRLLR